MTSLWLCGGVLGWILCGGIHYGLIFAYWQRSAPETAQQDATRDQREAALDALLGPFALLLTGIWVLLLSRHGYQGFLWRPLSAAERARLLATPRRARW